jgi:hypothetical protein
MRVIFNYEMWMQKIKKKLRGFNSRVNYTAERPPFVGKVSANFCG